MTISATLKIYDNHVHFVNKTALLFLTTHCTMNEAIRNQGSLCDSVFFSWRKDLLTGDVIFHQTLLLFPYSARIFLLNKSIKKFLTFCGIVSLYLLNSMFW